MHIHKQTQQGNSSDMCSENENELIDNKMRSFLKSCFRDNPSFSSLPTVRELFATILGHYQDRISGWRSEGDMPELNASMIRKELFFLQNLEEEIVTIQDRSITIWNLYQEALRIIEKRAPAINNQPSAEVVSLNTRVAQYIHIVRSVGNARKATY